jgi:hypothetical protein
VLNWCGGQSFFPFYQIRMDRVGTREESDSDDEVVNEPNLAAVLS